MIRAIALLGDETCAILLRIRTRVSSIKDKITNDNLSDPEKEELNQFVKNELAALRKSFIDVLLRVDAAFGKDVKNNLDGLVDGITEAIFNDELKLSRAGVYEKHIGSKISYSRNTLIAQLYNYKGISRSTKTT